MVNPVIPAGRFRLYINPDRDILDMDELSALYHKDFTIPRLQETKDAYLFEALTGYAYKDALLSPDNVAKFFDGEDWIVKTGRRPGAVKMFRCCILQKRSYRNIKTILITEKVCQQFENNWLICIINLEMRAVV